MSKRARAADTVRPTFTATSAEGKLQRHLRDLGLEDAVAYRAWCRAHGFSPVLHKGWQDRREEVRRRDKLAEQAVIQADLRRHWQALGFGDEGEYKRWCDAHGFTQARHKTPEQRRQEAEARAEERARQALAKARPRQRRPDSVIAALARGELRREDLAAPHDCELAALFAEIGGGEARPALRDLLLLAHKKTRLLSPDFVFPHLGDAPGNTYPHALLQLARHVGDWLRPLADWTPDSHNAGRQFASLARHLLAHYHVPAFLDSVWFLGNDPDARRQQRWFGHVGRGGNIRRADLPLRLSEKAAHWWQFAPFDVTPVAALRWAQVRALGGDEPLARTLIATRLGQVQPDEEFWMSVLHFFVNNPMLDPACIGPMVDYIQARKYGPPVGEIPPGPPLQKGGEDGPPAPNSGGVGKTSAASPLSPPFLKGGLGGISPIFAGPSEPGFSMKGRTALALWRRVEVWQNGMAREARKTPLTWVPSGLGEYARDETDPDEGRIRWTVRELLTHKELTEEGRAMRHCVASYARSCAKGNRSVWSLGWEDGAMGVRRRVLTIEVQMSKRLIAQARGRCNKSPEDRRAGQRLSQAPAHLRAWAAQEGLKVASHL